MNPNNPGAPAGVPVKRKRGRPRKDETQAHAIDKSTSPLNKPVLRPMITRTQAEASAAPKPVPNIPIASKGKDHIEVDVDQGAEDDHNNDEMVGQVVTGVLESAFDAGYFLTVRVGESDVYMRGLVFKEACVVPITADNDIAPNAKMYERRDTPIPMKLAPQVAETAGNSSSRPTENIEEHHPLPQPQQQMPIEWAPQPPPQLQPPLQLQPQSQPQPQPQPQLQPQSQPQPHQQQQQQQQQHVPIDSVPQNEVQNVVLLQGPLGIPSNIGQPQLPQEQDKLSVDKQQSVALEEHDRQSPQVVFNPDSQEMKSLAEEPPFEPGLGVLSLEQNVQDSFLEEPVIVDGGEKVKAPESSEPVQKGDHDVVREDNASLFVNEPHCDSKEKQSSPRNEGPEESSEPLVKLQKTEQETVDYPIVQPLNDAVPGDQNSESNTSISAAKTDEIAAAILPMEVLIQPGPTFTAEEPVVVPQVVEPEIGSASGFQISMENTDNDEPLSEKPMETG